MNNHPLTILRLFINSFGYDIKKQKKKNYVFDYKESFITNFTCNNINYNFFIANEHDVIQKEHAMGRLYEQEELIIIKENFTEGIFVDIGANVGNHSIYACLDLNASRVIAFEPAIFQHTIFSFNIIINNLQKNIELYKLALSSRVGTGRLLTPVANNCGRAYLNNKSQGEIVDLSKGDLILKDKKISFLKIDVEGNEIDVLTGLSETIDRCHPDIFIEVDNLNIKYFFSFIDKFHYKVLNKIKKNAENENFMIKYKDKI
jgi:FkbM family methyltransferase